MYRACLPLLANDVYRQCTMHTWPVQYSDSSLTIQIDMPSVVGFNTKTGEMFHPDNDV